MSEETITPEQQEVEFAQLLGEENFDKEKYLADAQKLKESGLSLSILNPQAYKKDKQDKSEFEGAGLSFKTEKKDGKIIARGSNGEVIEAKTPEELHALVAKSFKKHNETLPDKGKNSLVSYITPKKDPQDLEAFAKTFINEGIAVNGIKGDVPQDPKFWQDFKQEYLANPEHSVEEWKHLTRAVPAEYMGEKRKEQVQTQSPVHQTPQQAVASQQQPRTEASPAKAKVSEQTQENPKMSTGAFIKELRNGNNPNLTPQQPQPVRQQNNTNQQSLLQQRMADMNRGR